MGGRICSSAIPNGHVKNIATDTTNRADGDIMQFEDGTTIVPGTTYWFRVEPVKWSCLSVLNQGGSDERYSLVCEKIIDQANWYDGGYVTGVDYWDSVIRQKVRDQIQPQMFGLISGINFWTYQGDKLTIATTSNAQSVSEKALSIGVTDYARVKGVSVWADGYNNQDYNSLALGNTNMGPGANMLVKNNGQTIMISGNNYSARPIDAGYYGVLPAICLIRSGMQIVGTANA